MTHMVINLVAVAIFAIDFWLRSKSAEGANSPIVLSLIGVALLCVSGWLGGKMVYIHGVAVTAPREPGRAEPARMEEGGPRLAGR